MNVISDRYRHTPNIIHHRPSSNNRLSTLLSRLSLSAKLKLITNQVVHATATI